MASHLIMASQKLLFWVSAGVSSEYEIYLIERNIKETSPNRNINPSVTLKTPSKMKTTYNNDEKSMIHHDNLYVFGFTLPWIYFQFIYAFVI